ncbi:unnamed protein product [Haemonchus placei]|uniref:UBX domain-containing protein n=1 Tax=Haemonchus placei TaxID=6290 RepID=A0A0N4X143_HAEPC|nr:unnamed protein product [Haemonchus placei]
MLNGFDDPQTSLTIRFPADRRSSVQILAMCRAGCHLERVDANPSKHSTVTIEVVAPLSSSSTSASSPSPWPSSPQQCCHFGTDTRGQTG